MPDAFGILAPSYVLGEEERKVDALAGYKAVLEAYKMPDRQDLWGWDCYRKTNRSRTELAHESVSATLSRSGVAASDIDALIVCCGDGLNYHAQNRFVSELSERLDLRCDFVTWVGGAGCASPFSAVKIARALVLGDSYRNILVITVDKVDNDAARFQRYGVFSDGACSFVVRGSGAVDFAVVGAEVSTSLSSLRNGGQDLAQKCQLIQAVFKRLAGAATFPFAGSAFFGSNVFLPIQQLELSVMPVKGLVLTGVTPRATGIVPAAIRSSIWSTSMRARMPVHRRPQSWRRVPTGISARCCSNAAARAASALGRESCGRCGLQHQRHVGDRAALEHVNDFVRLERNTKRLLDVREHHDEAERIDELQYFGLAGRCRCVDGYQRQCVDDDAFEGFDVGGRRVHRRRVA